MKKQEEIDKYKEEFKGMSFSEINAWAIDYCSKKMQQRPNTWREETLKNRKYLAAQQLLNKKP